MDILALLVCCALWVVIVGAATTCLSPTAPCRVWTQDSTSYKKLGATDAPYMPALAAAARRQEDDNIIGGAANSSVGSQGLSYVGAGYAAQTSRVQLLT
ncbi:hypothetical protein HaLaN_13640 [Haematococcus lacustris]|uniref:Uncharacterized protein n=1 Tax=Haematococcus lacustris TaxID=44745 RepID=A0A699ZCU2_HAELA|nr:hypothetical protein HaLaN_13640 [Haematococcus lacustris]